MSFGKTLKKKNTKKQHWGVPCGRNHWARKRDFFWGGGGFFVHLSVLSISIEKASTCAQSASAKGPRLAA